MKIFPVFHHSLLRPHEGSQGLPGQEAINEAESRNIRGRILERNDETEEVVEKWEFEDILDCWKHPTKGVMYQVKWRYHAPTWQPARDMKGNNELLREYHAKNPDKPPPPRWVGRLRVTFAEDLN